jgi:hypothetical protein
MKCEECGCWIKGLTHPRYSNEIKGLCLWDNCTSDTPHHIRHNSNEECKWGYQKENNESNTPNSGTSDKD